MSQPKLMPLELLTRLRITRPDIWQMWLVDERGLSELAREREIRFSFTGEHVRFLWQLGLLKADVIESTEELNIVGLTLIEQRDEKLYYADSRNLVPFAEGIVGSIGSLNPFPDNIRLKFHPFRYYPLYHIHRVLKIGVSPIQLLFSVKGYMEIVENWANSMNQWSKQEDSISRIIWWNDVASLAIASEPHNYSKLFGIEKMSLDLSEEDLEKLMNEHEDEYVTHLKTLGLDSIEQARRDLCIDAEILDRNKNLHIILRLTKGERRIDQIKGKVGGAMYLLTMAEMIRRSAEKAFDTQLPEEDELGFGIIIKEARERVYGSARLIDADRKVHQEFLRQFGLDYGLRLRWYVEGPTEYGALKEVLGNYSAIDLVNLAGNVAARRGKGVGFRESLISDINTNTFSLVTLDSDVEVNVRAVRKAAEDDQMCGAFFIHDPDFEIANFTLDELCKIAWNKATEFNVDENKKVELNAAIQVCKTGGEVIKAIKTSIPELEQMTKGEEWGKALMLYALNQPDFDNPKTGKLERRPVLQSLDFAFGAITSSFHISYKEHRTNPKTGLPEERPKNN